MIHGAAAWEALHFVTGQEYSECLEEKLKALNSELAARQVEETDLEDELEESQQANARAREQAAQRGGYLFWRPSPLLIIFFENFIYSARSVVCGHVR